MPRTAATALVALLLGTYADAQCTLPAEDPANTQFVPGQDATCATSGVMLEDTTCNIECLAGTAQGAAGTYAYTCAAGGVFDPEPAPVCTPCEVATYNPTPGAAECLACPAQATSPAGSDEVTDCICNAGFTGTILLPADTCDACALATFKPTVGPELCTDCTAQATTAAIGSTAITDCVCDAGFTGTILLPADTCDACALATFKPTVGPELCTDCTAQATTAATGATAITECVCDLGHTGTILLPADTCDACELATFKATVGPEACTACTADATTAAVGATAIALCLCEPGHTGEVLTVDDTCTACLADTFKSETGPVPAICDACPANALTPAGETGATEIAQCICDVDNGWTGVIEAPEDECLPDPDAEDGLSTGAIIGIAGASIAAGGVAVGGIVYAKSAFAYSAPLEDPWSSTAGGSSSGAGGGSDPLLGGSSTRYS